MTKTNPNKMYNTTFDDSEWWKKWWVSRVSTDYSSDALFYSFILSFMNSHEMPAFWSVAANSVPKWVTNTFSTTNFSFAVTFEYLDGLTFILHCFFLFHNKCTWINRYTVKPMHGCFSIFNLSVYLFQNQNRVILLFSLTRLDDRLIWTIINKFVYFFEI